MRKPLKRSEGRSEEHNHLHASFINRFTSQTGRAFELAEP